MKIINRKIAIIVSVAILAVLIGGFMPFLDYYTDSGSIIQSRSHNLFFDYTNVKYQAKVQVRTPEENITIGFSSVKDSIDFGLAVSGGSINRKFINITNGADRDARVHIRKSGNISSMVLFGENNFILKPGETRTISIELTPGNIAEGNYTGMIDVELRKARFAVFQFLI